MFNACPREFRDAASTGLGGGGQDDRELFSSVARDQVGIPRADGLKSLHHLQQAVVSALVPHGVVQRLEEIDIDHQKRQRPAGLSRPFEFGRERLVKAAPVGRPREGVLQRKQTQLFHAPGDLYAQRLGPDQGGDKRGHQQTERPNGSPAVQPGGTLLTRMSPGRRSRIRKYWPRR